MIISLKNPQSSISGVDLVFRPPVKILTTEQTIECWKSDDFTTNLLNFIEKITPDTFEKFMESCQPQNLLASLALIDGFSLLSSKDLPSLNNTPMDNGKTSRSDIVSFSDLNEDNDERENKRFKLSSLFAGDTIDAADVNYNINVLI